VVGRYNGGMDLHTELARLNATPELPEWVLGRVQELIDQAQQGATEALRQIARRDTELHAAQTKIQALTLELAHLRRMRFGARSEAFSGEERDLFQDTLASDLAAAEAELARKQAEAAANTEPQTPRPPRPRAGRQHLLGTAKLNGLDPAAWLRDTLERMPTCLNSQIDSLLPLRAEPLPQPEQ